MRGVRRLLLLTLTLLLAAAVPADAKRVGMRVRAVAFCASKTVNVRLTDGSIVARRHVVPGREIQTVVKATKDLLLYVKIAASWSTVQRGQTIRVLADGPDGERWEWRFQTRNKKALRDPTNYQACLKLKTRSGKFLSRMQARPGSWRFSTRITAGSLVTTRGSITVRSR
jgi:hypothetical protein